MEKLAEYFEKKKGIGVLSTTDRNGKVNAAVYARPHFMDENTAAFIMADRLTHANVQENPKACYLFIEDPKEYTGKRLYLTRTGESEDQALIEALRRRRKCSCAAGEMKIDRSFLVYFRVDATLPLIGDKK